MTDVVGKTLAMSSGVGFADRANFNMGRAFYDLKPEASDLAKTVSEGTQGGVALIKKLVKAFGAALSAANERRQSYGLLMSMDDRLLEDIGLSRGDIAPAVFGEVEKGPSLLERVTKPVVEYRQNRQAVKALRSLPDHLLADMGIERSDIERTVATGTRGGPRLVRRFAAPLAPWTFDRAAFADKRAKLQSGLTVAADESEDRLAA